MFESYDGFFHFRPDKWRHRMQSLTLTKLQGEEVGMIRNRQGYIYNIIKYIGEGIIIPGAGLFSGGMTTRKLIVAQKKLVIIREELTSRGQPLHEKDWRDYFIPMLMIVLGSTVTEMISVDLSSILPSVSVPGSPIAGVEAMATNTSSSVSSFFHGVADPTEQLYNQAAQGLSHLHVSIQSLALPSAGTDSSLANLAGFQTGVQAGSAAAEQGGSLGITTLVSQLTSKLEVFDKKKKAEAQVTATLKPKPAFETEIGSGIETQQLGVQQPVQKPEIQQAAPVAMPNAFDMSHMNALGVPTGIVVYS